MSVPDLSSAEWFKSSHSGPEVNCVEVAVLSGLHTVRDSKDPEGPALTFSAGSWETFIAEVKGGGFPAI